MALLRRILAASSRRSRSVAMKRSWFGICPRPVAFATFFFLVPLLLAVWARTLPAPASAARALLHAALGG